MYLSNVFCPLFVDLTMNDDEVMIDDGDLNNPMNLKSIKRLNST
jgi:hypothetical protein